MKVSEIEQTKYVEIALRERVLLDVHLDTRSAIESTRKLALPKLRMPRIRPLVVAANAGGFELGAGLGAVGADEIADRVRAIESMGIGADAHLAELRKIGAPLLNLFVFR
jgi:hypothetical protein